MAQSLFVQTVATVVAASSPLVFAGIGETLTEKAGIVNLSLDGSILLAAMAAFAVSMVSGSLLLGIVVAMGVGACIAWIVAYSSIALKQNQVAVGFVLTLLCADLSSFWGNPYVRKPGPSVPHWPVPGLVNIPVLGPMLFDQNILVYLSYLLIIGTWLWISRTQPGLRLRSVGERPEAAFSRGIAVEQDAIPIRFVGRRIGGVGRSHLFSEHQARLESSPYRRRRLDRSGYRHLWRVESLPSGAGSLSVRRTQVFGQHPATSIFPMSLRRSFRLRRLL